MMPSRGIQYTFRPPSAFKRQLMVRLRDRGLDAGVCKSKWEKKGGLVSGDHEYVDVNIDGSRCIIVVSVVEEFRIARPTQGYDWVLQMLPQILVCKMDELKEMVRIMCRAIKKSMKQMKMPVPPWRRLHYSQAKWFGPYKRTTNQFSTKNSFQQHSVTQETGPTLLLNLSPYMQIFRRLRGATPKLVLPLMNIIGLHIAHVKSHLQMCRVLNTCT